MHWQTESLALFGLGKHKIFQVTNLFERKENQNSQRVSLHSPLPLRTDTLIGR